MPVMAEGRLTPWMPSSPPVKEYQRKTMAHTSEPREIWSMPK